MRALLLLEPVSGFTHVAIMFNVPAVNATHFHISFVLYSMLIRISGVICSTVLFTMHWVITSIWISPMRYIPQNQRNYIVNDDTRTSSTMHTIQSSALLWQKHYISWQLGKAFIKVWNEISRRFTDQVFSWWKWTWAILGSIFMLHLRQQSTNWMV